ncbi:MAG: hypothetical protein Q8N30_08595 [Methylococcales bacterium]|nr:hypothetical protein [Methylococcales bacterium]
MSDNLTHIKDIGLAREKWLNDHGIATYTQLAKADPNWICEQLKNDGKPSVPLEVVQGWIEEASTITSDLPMAESVTNVIPFHPQHHNEIMEDGWNNFATFFVAYQHKHRVKQEPELIYRTVVYRTVADHIEANEYQQWNCIEGEELSDWMLKCVNNIISKEADEEKSTAIPVTHPQQEAINYNVTIEGIQLQNDVGETVSSSVDTSFLPRVLSCRYPLTVTPTLSVAQTNSGVCAWKGTLALYISKMPRGQLVQESQQQTLYFSSIADAYHRHSFQPISLPSGLYRIQIILWTQEPSRKLLTSKEYIFQLV